MKPRTFRAGAAAGLAIGLVAVHAANAASVVVTVQGLKASLGGTVYGTLYCGEANWLDASKASALAQAPVTGETVVLKYENVAPGGCATTLYHDENGNAKLDVLRGPMPIPTEGVAMSNNAGRRGTPRYKPAEFEVKEPGVAIEVKMIY